MPTPGHTAHLTHGFFSGRQGFHNSSDLEAASRSIDHLGSIADIIVPAASTTF